MNVHPWFSHVSPGVRLRLHLPRRLLIVSVAFGTPAAAIAQFADAPFNERPADASITITNSHRYEGSFTLSAVARVCGEVPAELNFSGAPSFIVQFYPDDGQGPVRDVTFSSNKLVGGVTKSSDFSLSTIVYSPTIGSPPAYVLDATKPGNSGLATLELPGPGTVELTVMGVNELGEDIQMLVRCGPRDEN